LPIAEIIHHIAERAVKGILAVYVSEVVAAGRSHILEHLCHHQANAPLMQRIVQGSQSFRCGLVDVNNDDVAVAPCRPPNGLRQCSSPALMMRATSIAG